jgi:hypothetical protein
MVMPEQPILAAAVVVVLVSAVLAAQAAQVSSYSNTPHLFNPYSHSKVLASGLHLLA